MDADFWTSRLAAAKRQYTLQNHHQSSHLDRSSIDDFEVEDDVRPEFPCPFCYEDFDIASLCSHLEDEHSYESSVTVCPICSIKVSRDMLSHIKLHHGHLFKISFKFEILIPVFCSKKTLKIMLFLKSPDKYQCIVKINLGSISLTENHMQRRRRLRRVAIPNSQALSLLGRDLREAHLQVLLGGAGHRLNNASVSNVATDPFLSSLIMNFPASETEEISKSVVANADDTSKKKGASSHIWKSSFDPSLSREEREKAAGRAGFMQDLLLSMLFGD